MSGFRLRLFCCLPVRPLPVDPSDLFLREEQIHGPLFFILCHPAVFLFCREIPEEGLRRILVRRGALPLPQECVAHRGAESLPHIEAEKIVPLVLRLPALFLRQEEVLKLRRVQMPEEFVGDACRQGVYQVFLPDQPAEVRDFRLAVFFAFPVCAVFPACAAAAFICSSIPVRPDRAKKPSSSIHFRISSYSCM